MDRNYLNNLVSGLLGAIRMVPTETSSYQAYVRDPSGLTGVARYLRHKYPEPTGVEKYIRNLEELAAANKVANSLEAPQEEALEEISQQEAIEKEPMPSGVAKYLEKLEQAPKVSKVSKYITRKSVAEKDCPKKSRVEKYLEERSDESETVSRLGASGVSKYIEKSTSDIPNLSGVAKYLINQKHTANNKKITLTGVAKYLEDESIAARKTAAAEIVAKYIEEQRVKAVELEKEKEKQRQLAREQELEKARERAEAAAEKTGVARYVKEKAIQAKEKPPVSGVSKYLARQILQRKTAPVLSRVDKYIADKNKEEKVIVSGVSKYLAKEVAVAKKAPKLSGVEKYLEKKSEEPPLSRVEKYLKRQMVATYLAEEKV